MNEQTENLLKRLDDQHVTLAIALGKRGKDTLYSEAAAEIRRLLELLKGEINVR